ncbi:MAG: hypothetical protein PHN82_06695 [bacterium]|nr:hypothetical protein [bacterium]
MRAFIACAVAALACGGTAGAAEEVIGGAKIGEFAASPGTWLERPVVIEDTFDGIVQQFSQIETENNYTPEMYLKFRLGHSPYPCIGLNVPSLTRAVGACAPGDLVRVRGNLRPIQEKRERAYIRGDYSGGPSWEERVYANGPLKTEYFFSVGSVEKGWGKREHPKELFDEGAHLWETSYREIPLAELNVEPGALVEKAVRFEGTFKGLDDAFGERETAAGITAEHAIKFRIEGMALSCYLPRTDAALAAMRTVPAGSTVHLYGRVRLREAPTGAVVGFYTDRLTRLVPPPATPSAEAGAPPPPAGS